MSESTPVCPLQIPRQSNLEARHYVLASRLGRYTKESAAGTYMKRQAERLERASRRQQLKCDGVEWQRLPTVLHWQQTELDAYFREGEIRTVATPRHFHGDLQLDEFTLHFDYLLFIGWGPTRGHAAVVVSVDGRLLGHGAEIAMPPGGLCTNWPLGIQYQDLLITVCSEEIFDCGTHSLTNLEVAVWRRTAPPPHPAGDTPPPGR